MLLRLNCELLLLQLSELAVWVRARMLRRSKVASSTLP